MIEGILTTLISRALGKHDVCFIADGQSGSCKSYTLFNGPDALAPGIGKDILNKEYCRYESTVTCTALEVSQDGLKDLLCAEGSPATAPPQSQSPRGKKSQALVNPPERADHLRSAAAPPVNASLSEATRQCDWRECGILTRPHDLYADHRFQNPCRP